jgi:hypothetical protein
VPGAVTAAIGKDCVVGESEAGLETEFWKALWLSLDGVGDALARDGSFLVGTDSHPDSVEIV